ncbi:metal ABC transporter substrate-binding protein [Dysosmobacter sp.]|uniref:metal ABC transporter substrate-binding protein n=1 Tax=Dysosmobacter sp. TaxID=2591382 RepID=UPI002A87C57B|nr:metal ABC transporter substrate-binding protein [Dysosmobacter sp.]MDY3281886.1 metal ABC transporter substrate-binding protein [Dysosmobacter sp.]
MKKRTALLAALALALGLTACGQSAAPPAEDGRLRIMAANFPAYDLARAACGDLAEVRLLLPPGAESHSYEPTPRNIIDVENSDLFLYTGGESDTWVDTILESLDRPVETLKLMDCVELLEEETLEGMTAHGHDHDHDDHDHEHGLGEVLEADEHVWTSPVNAGRIAAAIAARAAELDSANATVYEANAAAYQARIDDLDSRFRAFFTAVDHPVMVFGDRFPLRYFAEEYGVRCLAAFPGCSTQTEPSAATVAYLIEEIEEEHLSTVYYIEFSNHLVADSVAEAAGVDTALFHSCHNVSQQQLDDGVTYLSLMEENLETLRRTMG